MALTGEYARRAKRSYKTRAAKNLLAHVRLALAQMDLLGTRKECPKELADVSNELEMAADYFDLYGERKSEHPI